MSSHQSAIPTVTETLLAGRNRVEDSSGAPARRFILNNRAHGAQTELIFFEGGWLSVRQHGWQTQREARLINLKYLDPKPQTYRKTAKRSLFCAIGLFAGAAIAAILAALSAAPGLMIVTAIIVSIAAVATLASYIYRSEEVAIFSTLNGRAPAIKLFASPGCRRQCRTIARKLRFLIEAVHTSSTSPQESQLEDEIREHQRLGQAGILSAECIESSTQRILNRSD